MWRGWLAGMIDGEGSIMINRANNNNCAARITVANTNKKILNRVKKITGCGSIRVSHRGSRYDKVGYVWQCGRKDDLKHVLVRVLPYLVGKQRQAKLMLRFLALDASKVTSRNKMRDKMKLLNKRGPSATQPPK